MPLVGGFGSLELVLYGVRELVKQQYDLNQSEHSVWTIWTNERSPLWPRSQPVSEGAAGVLRSLSQCQLPGRADRDSQGENREDQHHDWPPAIRIGQSSARTGSSRQGGKYFLSDFIKIFLSFQEPQGGSVNLSRSGYYTGDLH